MLNTLRVLVVEDSIDDTFFIVRELQRGGFHVVFERVETQASLQAALEISSWDLIISDYSMPQFDGASALALYKQSGLDIPFIIVSGLLGEERAVQMLKSGAHDYIKKENLERLVPAVQRELTAARERQVRRQTEAATDFLASIVRSCDDAIVGKTLDGTVVSWNAGAERLYGYTAMEMIGRSISVVIPQYRPDELAWILEEIRNGRHVKQFETVRIRKDGKPVEVSLTISPIQDGGGRVIGASTVARDITRRKEEESQRLALIQDLTAALSHTPDQPGS